MKIYTRQGDAGDTGLRGGQRVPKNHARIEALGTIDELNSYLGWARLAWSEPPAWLHDVQVALFDLGAEVASPDHSTPTAEDQLSEHDVRKIEATIDEIENRLPSLGHFILPGGTEAASRLHIARGVARRAERRLLDLHTEEPIRSELMRYLNRLSDLLFVAAREANHIAGVADVPYRMPDKD